MNVRQALLDPTSVFARPEDILRERTLTRDEKIEILRRWEYDARDLEVATEENMPEGPPSQLGAVLRALRQLNVTSDCEHAPPTKQGGIRS